MAFFNKVMYLNWGNGGTTGYFALPLRAASTAYTVGTIVRPAVTPTFGNEKAFICTTAGTTSAAGDASWSTGTRGVNVTDGTVTWHECSGHPAVNGDKVNTPSWAEIKAIGGSASRGTIIKRNSGTSYHFTAGGTPGASEPAFSDTVGSTVVDGSCTWTCLGLTATFPAIKAPHSRWVNAHNSAWVVEGGTVYIANIHNEVSTTQFNSSSTGSLSLYKVICHNAAGSYPPTPADITTGARVETTAVQGVTWSFWGTCYFYGITFVGAFNIGGTTSASYLQNWAYLDTCSFQMNANGATISLAGNAGDNNNIIWNNCTVKFLNTASYISTGNTQWIWQNTGLILEPGSAVPAWLISLGSSIYGYINTVVLNRLDLGQLTGKLYASYNDNKPGCGVITVQDCALHPNMILTPHKWPGQFVQIIRSSSDSATNKTSRYAYEGNETTETSITRVGGAVDPTGAFLQSRKITTLATAEWARPYKAEPFAAWNNTVGANVTVTVNGLAFDGLPNNDHIWLELEYLNSSSAPLGTVATTGKANILAAATAVTADSSAWNGATAAITFDGVSANVTLSNGNLTATHSSTANNSGARSLALLSTGKYYFEVTVTASHGSGDAVGIMDAAATYTQVCGNTAANYALVYRNTGVIWVSTTNSGKTLSSMPVTGPYTICVAVDLNARLIWFRKDAGNWNGDAGADPATGTNGVTLAAAIAYAPFVSFGATATAAGDNFTSKFTGLAAPSGFTNWIANSPFKLTKTITPGLPGYVHARVRAAKANAVYYIDPKIEMS